MSEVQPRGPEQQHTAESSPESPERSERRHTREKNIEAAPNKAEIQQTIEKLQTAAKHEAVSGKDVSVEKTVKNPRSVSSPFVNHELKQLMYKRTLTHVQKQLSAPARLFSKVTHNTVVDSVSSGAEKTIARSKGFLVGSIVAFAGATYSFFSAKYYGFSYNAFVFVALFCIGYMVTTLAELSLAKIRRKS